MSNIKSSEVSPDDTLSITSDCPVYKMTKEFMKMKKKKKKEGKSKLID